MDQRAAAWIAGHDTGVSSKTIWATMMGVKPRWSSHPHDAADLGRCLRLLEVIPEWIPRMPEMRAVSREWAAILTHWDELAALMEEEVGIDLTKGDRAPRTYARMKEIIKDARS